MARAAEHDAFASACRRNLLRERSILHVTFLAEGRAHRRDHIATRLHRGDRLFED